MPEHYVDGILERVKPEYISRMYGVNNWKSPAEFLTLLARQSGKLLKGGEPDLPRVARRVINDLQRGRLPYFVPPPSAAAAEDESAAAAEKDSKNKDDNEVVKAEQDLSSLHQKIVQKVEFSVEDQYAPEDNQSVSTKSTTESATTTTTTTTSEKEESVWDDLDL